jgi:hypothetical protein
MLMELKRNGSNTERKMRKPCTKSSPFLQHNTCVAAAAFVSGFEPVSIAVAAVVVGVADEPLVFVAVGFGGLKSRGTQKASKSTPPLSANEINSHVVGLVFSCMKFKNERKQTKNDKISRGLYPQHILQFLYSSGETGKQPKN